MRRGATRVASDIASLRVRLAILALTATALAATSAHPAAAQNRLKMLWDDARWAASDAFFVVTSPVHADRSDLVTLGWLTAATGLTLVLDDEVDAWVTDHPSSLPVELLDPFREQSGGLYHLGSGTRLVQASGVTYLIGIITGSRALRDAGVGCAAAEKTQAAIRHGVYKSVSRLRPLTADGDPFVLDVPGGGWDYHSFFGGHGANIMTCASYVVNRFDLGIAEPVILGLAVGVGLGRIPDRRHWLSDAFVGAAFGYAIGKAVADRQNARLRDERAENDDPSGNDPAGRGLGAPLFDYRDGRVLIGWVRRF